MGTLLKEKTIVAFSENNSHADGAQLPNGAHRPKGGYSGRLGLRFALGWIFRMPKCTTCEVRSAGGWRTMDIDEALATQETDGRCPACHEAVRPHKTGTTGQAAHFEHRKQNPSCPLSR